MHEICEMLENNLRIPTIKNVKFSEYCFNMNTNILGDFQICISVPLMILLTMRSTML